jgi:nicotinamide-nucleotide amidase
MDHSKVVEEYERPYIIHKTILTQGQGESLVAERIEDGKIFLIF